MELIDISNVNGKVNWYKVRLTKGGVWLKATEGVSYNDPNYHANYKAAKKALLRVGAYHFARPDHNEPEDEANHFANVIGVIGKRDLRPVLDFEIEARKDTNLTDWVRRFNRKFKMRTGIIPMFYSYPAFIETMHLVQPVGNGLWIANYSINDGKRHHLYVPKPWKHYAAHQYTSKGRVAGVNGNVDRSYAPRKNAVLAYPMKGGI